MILTHPNVSISEKIIQDELLSQYKTLSNLILQKHLINARLLSLNENGGNNFKAYNSMTQDLLAELMRYALYQNQKYFLEFNRHSSWLTKKCKMYVSANLQDFIEEIKALYSQQKQVA